MDAGLISFVRCLAESSITCSDEFEGLICKFGRYKYF